jgi:hypothetical protein
MFIVDVERASGKTRYEFVDKSEAYAFADMWRGHTVMFASLLGVIY